MILSKLSNRLCATIVLFWTFFCLPVSAQPDPADAAQYHYELGVSAAEKGNYRKALEEFQTSYAIRQVPRLLINIGRAHHRLGNLREAIDIYESYLKIEPNAPQAIIAQVRDFLANAKKELIVAQRRQEMEPPKKTIYIKETREPRPLWRWLLGGSLSAGGISVLSLGLYSWTQDGACASGPVPPAIVCDRIYDTQRVGVPMVVVGGVVVATGVTLLAWPGTKIKQQVESP